MVQEAEMICCLEWGPWASAGEDWIPYLLQEAIKAGLQEQNYVKLWMTDVEGHQGLLPETMLLGSVGMPNAYNYFIYKKSDCNIISLVIFSYIIFLVFSLKIFKF